MGKDGRLGERELDDLLAPVAPVAPCDNTAEVRGAPAVHRRDGHRHPGVDDEHPTGTHAGAGPGTGSMGRARAAGGTDPGPGYPVAEGFWGPDVLAQGPEGPTLGQRSTAVVRRHHWVGALAVVAAILLAAGGMTWMHSRPGTAGTGQTATSAWYRPGLPAMTSVNVTDGVVTSTLYLQVPPGTPVPIAVQLSGQGLGGGVLTQDGSDVTVTSPLDCSTIGDLSAHAQPTVLQVRYPGRTGAWVTDDLPLSVNPGTAGIPVADAVAALRRACVGQLSDSLVLQAVRAAATPAGEVLMVRIQNPTRHDLVLLGAQTTLAPSDASIGAPTPTPATNGQDPALQGTLLPAGGTTSATLPVVRTNCADRTPGAGTSAGLGAGAGRPTGDFALWVSPPGPESYPRDDSWTARELSPAARSAVATALGAPCLGAPALSYRVAAVRAGDPGSGTVTFQVLARSTTGLLRVSGQGALGNLLAVTVVPQFSGPGRLVVDVQMSYAYCATGFDQILPPPPVLSLQARVGPDSYPFQLAVGNRTVLDAFGRACGQQPDLSLARQAGWET